MTYDTWKTTPPAHDGIACRGCLADEAEADSWLCGDCKRERDAEEETES